MTVIKLLMISIFFSETAWAFVIPNVQSSAPSFVSRERRYSLSASVNMEDATDHLMELFNSQITNELSFCQMYLAASIWCDQRELNGMSSYMREESNEERCHALQFIDFATKRDLPLSLEALNAQPCDWTNPEHLWEDILIAEKRETQALYELADAAMTTHDHAIMAFLQPFHMAQIDSEDKVSTILAKVRDESKTPGLLRQLDTELGLVHAQHA